MVSQSPSPPHRKARLNGNTSSYPNNKLFHYKHEVKVLAGTLNSLGPQKSQGCHTFLLKVADFTERWWVCIYESPAVCWMSQGEQEGQRSFSKHKYMLVGCWVIIVLYVCMCMHTCVYCMQACTVLYTMSILYIIYIYVCEQGFKLFSFHIQVLSHTAQDPWQSSKLSLVWRCREGGGGVCAR